MTCMTCELPPFPPPFLLQCTDFVNLDCVNFTHWEDFFKKNLHLHFKGKAVQNKYKVTDFKNGVRNFNKMKRHGFFPSNTAYGNKVPMFIADGLEKHFLVNDNMEGFFKSPKNVVFRFSHFCDEKEVRRRYMQGEALPLIPEMLVYSSRERRTAKDCMPSSRPMNLMEFRLVEGAEHMKVNDEAWYVIN